MIEKCSIGNMSYNIQNITLILLILILIIVIIYYLKNSNTKHNDLIEKYTTSATDIKTAITDTQYNTHNAIASSQTNSQFPTTGTEVTLRPCEVQFNNTFDDNPNGTVKYVYEDGWKEIATLKESSTSDAIAIPKKIISRSNETNSDVITNFSERSKCFKKMSATDNKYRYRSNDLIQYTTGTGDSTKNGIHSQLKEIGSSDDPENYMEMKFNIGGTGADPDNYYTNLKTSICSLRYANTLTGLSGKLIRLSLNENNIITDIKRVNIDPDNNHIFNIDHTFEISSLITSGNSGSYRYNTATNSYQYVTSNSTPSSKIVTLYKFNRNLLCDKILGAKTYQDIKTYNKLNNVNFSVSAIINFNLPAALTIANTALPTRYNDNKNIGGIDFAKDTLLNNIGNLILTELVAVNADTTTSLNSLTIDKKTLETARNTFITNNSTKQIFIDNAIIKSNYDDALLKKYNVLLDSKNYNLKLNEFKYIDKKFASDSTDIKIALPDEPIFTELLSVGGEIDVYETVVYKYDGSGNFREYNVSFSPNTDCKILIVGGGGGGGQFGGGGGGGAILFKSSLVLDGDYVIKVGRGGVGRDWGSWGNNGDNGTASSFEKIGSTADRYIAVGGGGGGTRQGGAQGTSGTNGGSGGGGSHSDTTNALGLGGSSIKNPYTGWESYGNAGGNGKRGFISTKAPDRASGGGGGAGSVGGNTNDDTGGGNGGAGKEFIETFGRGVGHNGWFGGGGGGNTYYGSGNGGYGNGGNGLFGGGGNGGFDPGIAATNGMDGTGGGGGGGKWDSPGVIKGGNGGSGIVILIYKKNSVLQSNRTSKKITLQNESSFTHIYNQDNILTLNSNIKAEILIVGGGGGGGGGIGGGGGAGAVVHIPSADMPSGTYTITIGQGGAGNYRWAASYKGGNSSIVNSTSSINIIAEGGGGTTGGHDHGDGSVGGSGGGAASPNRIVNTGGAKGNSSSLGIFEKIGKIFGNRGGNNTLHRRGNMTNAAGGGGAGKAAADTDPSGGVPGNGGDGECFNITGSDIYYGGGGGGGGHYIPGRGGKGGGGNGSSSGNGGNGGVNSGGGGGGGAWANTLGGNGGSGIVIIKYDNTNIKTYKVSMTVITTFTIIAGSITKTVILQGAYKIRISTTTVTLMKDTVNLSGITTLDIIGAASNGELTFYTNKIDIIYNILRSIDNVNNTNMTETLSKTYTANGTAIPYDNTKYNRYKINTNISKTYKIGSGVNFNIELYGGSDVLINRDNYNIRYEYLTSTDTDTLVNVNIYITIKPIPMSQPFTNFTIKTYSKASNGGNSAEIYAFIGNGSGTDLSTINTFNGISDWNTSLIGKDVWGIVAIDMDITNKNSALVKIENIASKCIASSTRICDIKKLIDIKNSITDATITTTTPELKSNINITSTNLFPMSTTTSPDLNYSITDYISYESSTEKAPDNRAVVFNILNSASKYVYFSE